MSWRPLDCANSFQNNQPFTDGFKISLVGLWMRERREEDK